MSSQGRVITNKSAVDFCITGEDDARSSHDVLFDCIIEVFVSAINKSKTSFGIMSRFKRPLSSDAGDRDSHFEQIHVMIEIKLLHFLHGLNKGVNVQIVIIDEKILESRHAMLLLDVV